LGTRDLGEYEKKRMHLELFSVLLQSKNKIKAKQQAERM